jgi:hypothetical protein
MKLTSRGGGMGDGAGISSEFFALCTESLLEVSAPSCTFDSTLFICSILHERMPASERTEEIWKMSKEQREDQKA